MDYDDNDFQSQSHHLAGEGSTKFPPVLRPYDLPKFEFDDTLQGHLRFDSLVETEVFLGIEGNEDNQWIEDFSRGNSGIEFSSSAAESCSIARRNNVWSEATSSESVEMLLKSVGQEDIIPVQSTVKNPDVCDELGVLVKQMEPSLKHDGNISSSTGDAIHLQSAMLNDEIHGNLSEIEDVVEERPGVEVYSQDRECETSADRIPSDLDPNVVNENCALPLTGGSLLTDGKFENVNESKMNPLVDESQENRMPEYASSVEIQVDNMVTDNISTTSAEVSNQETRHVSNDINDQSLSDLQVKNEERREVPVMGTSEAESSICITDDTPCLAAEVESVEEPNAVSSSIGEVEEPSTMIVKGDSNLPTVEGCSNAGCFNDSVQGSNHETVLHSGKEIEDQPDVNVHKVSLAGFKDDVVEDQSTVNALEVLPAAFKDDSNLEEHAVELCSSSTATCASLEPNIDSQSSVSKNKGVLLAAGRLGSDTLLNYSGASLLSVGDDIISKGECDVNNNFHVGGDSTLPSMHSSANLHQEVHAAETLICTNGASGVCNETVLAEDHSSTSIFVESVQMCKEKTISARVDVQSSIQDLCMNDLDKKEFSSHYDAVVGEAGGSLNVDKEVESSVSGVVSNANEMVALDLDSSPAVTNKSDIAMENSTMSDRITMDITPFTKKAVASVRDQQEVDRSPPVLGFTHLNETEDEKEETASEKFIESSETRLLCEAGDPSNVERLGEPQTVVADEVRQECSKETETYSLLVESTEKESDTAEKVVENSEELPVKESHENASLRISDANLIPREGEMVAQSGPSFLEKTCYDIDKKYLEEKEAAVGSEDKVSGKIVVMNTEGAGGNGGIDSVKPTCGSPTVIRAVQPSQFENKEGVEGGSEEQNIPVSEVIEEDASKVQSLSPKGKDDSKSESSFTFEVSSLAYVSGKESGKSSQPFSTISSSKLLIVEGSPVIPGSRKRKSKTTQNLSRGSPKVSDGETVCGGAKTTERKSRRASTKGTGKDSAKKDNLTKEETPVQKSERGDKLSNVSLISSGMGQAVQSNVVQLHTTAGTLPDLNSSTSPPSVFQQPFTDFQQVQLRAQIFVYGSLIQGVAPDEAYMISAFGGPDGGRSTWENAWRTALDRSLGQKSPSVNPETPLPPRSGARTSDQSVKQSGIQSKAISTPVGRASSKGTPSNPVNPMIPLSSPLWSIPTPSDTLQPISLPRGPVMEYQPALSPLHPYQTPPARNFVAHNTWLSQPPFRGPWIASSQTSTVDTSVRFPLLPNTEPVLLMPVKELSSSHSSGVKHVPSGSMVYSGGPPSVSTGAAPHLDLKKVTVSPGQHSSDSKPRKRKKVSNSGDPSQNILLSQSQPEPISAPAVTVTYPSGSFSIATPSSLVAKPSSEKLIMPPSSEKLIMPVASVSIIDNLKRGGREPEPRGILPEETLNKVMEAKLHAEEAAALAASAVNHSQEIWSQLDKQKYSDLSSDVEAKFASAAVAVAAAASVAKAAAAAANVACNAALQAKLMADEALVSSGYGNLTQCNGVSLTSDCTIISATATPVSMMKSDDRTNSSSSIIVAAKEAARKRVEAASAASKRAENLDAIVKAAELAAEAVSQAGKIVCMGDPLPLTELIEHGPNGYWKVPQVSSDLVLKSKNMNNEEINRDNTGADVNVSSKYSEGLSAEKEIQTTNHGKPTAPPEIPRDSMEDHVRLVDGIVGSPTASEKISRGQKGRKAPESEIGVGSTSFPIRIVDGKGVESSRNNNIKEGSQIEVFKNEGRFKAAWYPANVLSLNDGKAYVGYKELFSDEGLGPLKEWVALEREGDESPIIRVARPMTALQFEGTRKRRRAAMGNYSWSVGDRVDALIQDSWWEGVVTEKDKKDETTLTIHFPARNETSVVRAWHLRPSLFWKDGEWIELSSSREKDPSSHEGDTPQEKRLKTSTAVVEIKCPDKMSKSNDVEPGKTEESRLLDLSATDKVFNIGKNSRDGNRPDTLRMLRTGLQKEGSRVVFGVPKPSKKRKFMDVSKHYVGDQSRKNDEVKDSSRISKYLMPQGSRGWKNTAKTDLKEKRVAESKPKPAIKSGKPQSVSGRTLHQKAAPVSASDDRTVSDNSAKIKDSVVRVENASEKHRTMEFGSFTSTEGEAEGPILFSSLAIPLDAAPSKKASTPNPKAERANKGKLAPAGTGGKLAKIDEEKISNNSAKSASEVVEPRRSVRRIQPTSRLLEGLQSSLIISKIPSFSHDRSHKSQNKHASRGNNNG